MWNPADLTIDVGDTVHWSWTGSDFATRRSVVQVGMHVHATLRICLSLYIHALINCHIPYSDLHAFVPPYPYSMLHTMYSVSHSLYSRTASSDRASTFYRLMSREVQSTVVVSAPRRASLAPLSTHSQPQEHTITLRGTWDTLVSVDYRVYCMTFEYQ